MVESSLNIHEAMDSTLSITRLHMLVHARDPGTLRWQRMGQKLKVYLATLKAQGSQPRMHEKLSQKYINK